MWSWSSPAPGSPKLPSCFEVRSHPLRSDMSHANSPGSEEIRGCWLVRENVNRFLDEWVFHTSDDPADVRLRDTELGGDLYLASA